MAAKHGLTLFRYKPHFQSSIFSLQSNFIHTTPIYSEKQSGRTKVSMNSSKPVTYERFLKPFNIGHRKSWNSWNTSNLKGGLRRSETTIDDIFIRKFIEGTFPDMILSEIIIKRQHNIIRIAFLLKTTVSCEKFCFLIGYTEEFLSYWFQCIVKLEIQTVVNSKAVIFKKI